MRKPLVIAIDGPSGSGKSSTSRSLATMGGFDYLDTGALYRAATIALGSHSNLPSNEISEILEQSKIDFSADPKNPITRINGKDVSQDIRTKSVTDSVSKISAIPEVRKFLFQLQRSFIENTSRGIVVEGRDIGTVVAPEADMKIYLSADLQARSMRRKSELENLNLLELDQEVARELEHRDSLDSTRLSRHYARLKTPLLLIQRCSLSKKPLNIFGIFSDRGVSLDYLLQSF